MFGLSNPVVTSNGSSSFKSFLMSFLIDSVAVAVNAAMIGLLFNFNVNVAMSR